MDYSLLGASTSGYVRLYMGMLDYADNYEAVQHDSKSTFSFTLQSSDVFFLTLKLNAMRPFPHI